MTMDNKEIERYSRQLILPHFGLNAQINLKQKSALIIGCGGLGCPAALYLAVSGINRLGLVDYDKIELTNLHRQIAYNESMIGLNKASALAIQCKLRNSKLICDQYEFGLTKENALKIIENYDCILDCTDNVLTRYLINDCCVLTNRPLVSGSALRYDGQLTVYNYKNGPCLRCIYPKPPPNETINNCSDAGILGPIVGSIGTFQAIEAIKILTGIGETLSGRLLIYNGFDFVSRVVNLRKNKKDDCCFCNKEINSIDSFDYVLFCGSNSYDDKDQNLKILSDDERITCEKYVKFVGDNHLLLDVRTRNEFQICSLPNSISMKFHTVEPVYWVWVYIFWKKVKTRGLNYTTSGSHGCDYLSIENLKNGEINEIEKIIEDKKCQEIYIVCRRGNDSQIAVNILKNRLKKSDELIIKDLIGGLHEWHHKIDENFPKY